VIFLPNDQKKFAVSAHNVKIVIFSRKNLQLVNKSTIFALDKFIYLQLQIPLSTYLWMEASCAIHFFMPA